MQKSEFHNSSLIIIVLVANQTAEKISSAPHESPSLCQIKNAPFIFIFIFIYYNEYLRILDFYAIRPWTFFYRSTKVIVTFSHMLWHCTLHQINKWGFASTQIYVKMANKTKKNQKFLNEYNSMMLGVKNGRKKNKHEGVEWSHSLIYRCLIEIWNCL